MVIMKQTILVTGGTGYIGSHTIVELQQAGYDVVIVDDLSNSNIDVLQGIEAITHIAPKFYQGSCNDEALVECIFTENPSIAGVIHLAASKTAGESMQKPLMYYRNNILSLIIILEAMQRHGTRGIVFSSSCTVYGQPDKLPISENAPIKPALSPYGNTKQINEEIIRDTILSGAKFRAVLLRYFNPIGAHPSALIGEQPNGVPQNLIPYLTQTAAGIRKELSVFGNDYNTSDGSCIRDYINVQDLAAAHVAAIRHMMAEDQPAGENPEVFNVGTGRGVSVLELISTFESVTGVKIPYKIVGRREGDIEQVWANAERANHVLGWRAQKNLNETLLSAWHWQQHLDAK